jgi:hypothetical protein
MFFMSILHARRSPIGALKSVREDKHGQGTGEEAETGGNKRGNYSGLLSTAFCAQRLRFHFEQTRNSDNLGVSSSQQESPDGHSTERLGLGLVRPEITTLPAVKQGGRHGVSGAGFLFGS